MEQNTQTKTILIALLVLLILAAGYFWFTKQNTYKPTTTATETVSKTTTVKPKENVDVKQTDLNVSNTEAKLPSGFPTNIPVEISGIFESYSAVYKDHGVTQYTVGYNSSASKDSKWDEYKTFMTKEGYKFDENSTSKSKGVLSGTKDSNSLLIVVSEKENKTVVQISLLSR